MTEVWNMRQLSATMKPLITPIGDQLFLISPEPKLITESVSNFTEVSTNHNESTGWSSIDNELWVKVVIIVIATMAIVGNAIICLVVFLNHTLHTRTYYLITSLAGADLMTGVMMIIFNVCGSYQLPDGIKGEIICRFFTSQFLLWTCFHAGVFNLMTVTMERYVAIVYPYHYQSMFTKGKAVLFILVSWVCAIADNIYHLIIYHSEGGKCLIKWPGVGQGYQIFTGVTIFMIVFFIPLTLMFLAYWRIIHSLKKSAADLMRSNERRNSPAYALLEARRKVVMMLCTVVIAFGILWAPNEIFFLAYNLGADLDFTMVVFRGSVCLAFINCCINPFVYCYKNKQFRDALLKVLLMGGHRVNEISSSSYHYKSLEDNQPADVAV